MWNHRPRQPTSDHVRSSHFSWPLNTTSAPAYYTAALPIRHYTTALPVPSLQRRTTRTVPHLASGQVRQTSRSDCRGTAVALAGAAATGALLAVAAVVAVAAAVAAAAVVAVAAAVEAVK